MYQHVAALPTFKVSFLVTKVTSSSCRIFSRRVRFHHTINELFLVHWNFQTQLVQVEFTQVLTFAVILAKMI